MGITPEDLDAELRGHLALSIKERIDRGEDPEAARLAAMKEFGNMTLTRDSMQRVWRPRPFEAMAGLGRDLKFAMRALAHAKGMTATVIITLALGIGANVAIFSVVREVLLRPLVNRDEQTLIYIRQTAPGAGMENATFSVPEIDDLETRVKSVSAFGDFSTLDFTVIGLGPEPRVVKAGVVSGSFFEVMGLRPLLGRLVTREDDGPNAAPVVVLTHRFWTTSLNGDTSWIGKSIRVGARSATIVGILEPSIPYPTDTELIANVVTSPHHLGATMATNRSHRMTEVFGRLAPGVSLEAARAELTGVHADIVRENPAAYATNANMQLRVSMLRDQITAPARTVLLLLLGAAAVVFVIACSNVANLILARSVRRQGELAVRAALGAGRGALRRTLLAESLLLCGAGALLAMAMAGPAVALVARFAARFSVRAIGVTADSSVLWVGTILAIASALLLAYVPRLPTLDATGGTTGSGLRITPGTNRRLRLLATTQIAFSFVLLTGAAMLVATLIALQRTDTGYELQNVLAFDVPVASAGFGSPQATQLYQEATRRISELPGVEAAAVGNFVPWRDAGGGPGSLVFQFASDGYTLASGEENPHGKMRIASPRFFETLGIKIIDGRDFTDEDRAGGEPVAIVSQSVAQRMFPGGKALNGHVWWTDPLFGKPVPRRIVGVAADVDDESVVRGSPLTIYQPLGQTGMGGRLFVRAAGNPYALVPPVTRVVRELAPEQPVERPATLEDVRAAVLSPERLNAFVFSGFAGVALLIALVGIAGVLAFSVSARTREFGVRLAIGATPWQLLRGVLKDGVLIAFVGIAAGAVGGYVVTRVASGMFAPVQLPGVTALFAAAVMLVTAAVLASLMPAARAARVNVVQALRSE